MSNTRRTPKHAIEFYLRDFCGDRSLSDLAESYDLPRNTLYKTVRDNYNLNKLPLWELETLIKASKKAIDLSTLVSVLREYDKKVTHNLKEYNKTGYYEQVKPCSYKVSGKKVKLIEKV